MANDIEWPAEHGRNDRQRCISAEGKALHRSLWRFRNRSGKDKPKRREMDCTAADDRAQAGESRRAGTN